MNFFFRVIDRNSFHITRTELIISMPNTFTEFKKYLQFLTPQEEISEINHMIHDTLMHSNPDDNINKKYSVIKELNIIKKQILHMYNGNNRY